jgi:tetratricopeptide (TPR) repeat protein
MELDRLRGRLAEVRRGSGRTVLLAGDPGLGKTRLAAALAGEARDAGAAVVWWGFAGGPAGGDPVREGLRDALPPADLQAAIRGSDAEPLAPALAAWLAGPAAPSGPSSLRAEDLPAAIAATLVSLSARRTVVVVADDHQTAQDPDLRVVSRIAEAGGASGILLLAIARPGRLDEIRGHLPSAETLDLGPLSREAVASLLAEVLESDDLADRLAPEVHSRTGGNPLAVLETLDSLREADALVPDEGGGWRLRASDCLPGTPTTARAILAARLAALPRGDREVLECAACLGTQFDVGVLARALGRDAGRLLLRLARLERRHHLVRPLEGAAAFEHPEIRAAVLGDLAPEAAKAHHAAIASALEVGADAPGGPTRADLARHALLGGDGARASRHAVPALESLLADGRLSEALDLASLALADASAPMEAARARIHLLRGRVHAAASRMEDARADFERAASLADASGPLGREARILLAECLAMAGRLEEAREHVEAVESEAEVSGDRVSLVRANQSLGSMLGMQGRCEEALLRARRGVELCAELGDPHLDAEARYWLASALGDAGRMEEAARAAEETLGFLRLHGPPAYLVVWTQYTRSIALAYLGRPEEAARASAEGARFARAIGDLRMESTCRSFEAEQYRHLGRFAEAGPLHERALALAPKSGFRAQEVRCLLLHSLFLAATGRTRESAERLDRAEDIAVRAGQTPLRMPLLEARAALLGLWGDLQGAAGVVGQAEALALETGSEVLHIAATGIRGLWGGAGGGIDPSALDEAVRQRRTRGFVAAANRLELELARHEAATGRSADSVRRAYALGPVLAEGGFVTQSAECAVLLAVLGVRDPRSVLATLETDWPRLDHFSRLRCARALGGVTGIASLVNLVERDTEFALGNSPSERRESLRRAMLAGPERAAPVTGDSDGAVDR